MDLSDPEIRFFLVGLYAIFSVFGSLCMYALVRTIVTPLEQTSVPWQGTPLYPGDTRPDVQIVWGQGAKVFKVIGLAVGWLVIVGGIIVTAYICVMQGYPEIAGWDATSTVLMGGAHMLAQICLCALAINRGLRHRPAKT